MQPNPFVEKLHAYTPGDQPQGGGWTKLNTNEFPYPAAPEVIAAIAKCADDNVRLYPSPRCDELRRRLGELNGVDADWILVGNGSDEILRIVIQAYAGPDRMTTVVEPSYSLYPSLLQMAQSGCTAIGLEDDERFAPEIFELDWDLLLLPVPNPPIGSEFSAIQLEALASKRGLMLLDEAYADFSGVGTKLDLVKRHKNVVISRTYSKSFGLAGMRLGYAIAHPEVIGHLSKLADSYNVNRVSQAAGIAAIDAVEYYRGKVTQICADRDRLRGELEKRGFRVPQSHGNFLFARRADARDIFEKLRERKILVRYFSSPRLADGIRITIGTTDEVNRLLQALDQLT